MTWQNKLLLKIKHEKKKKSLMPNIENQLLYIVKSWYKPISGEKYVHWIKTKHIPEVLQVPGFNSAQLIRLEQNDGNGWPGIVVLYGLRDQTALDNYIKSSVRIKFMEQLNLMKNIHYSERFWGNIDISILND